MSELQRADLAIETVDLTKRFRKAKSYRDIFLRPFASEHTTALRGVSLSVEMGETFALIGPNGAGKTTLVKILSTLVLPTSGDAFVAGYDVKRHPDQIKKRIGCVVTEERSFYWRLTGRQNLCFFAVLNNIPTPAVKQKVHEAIALMGLEDDADKMFKDYSTGMKHRLAMARALLTDPEIVFFDEPTKSLDLPTAKTIRRLIADFVACERKRTVLFATHDLLEAEQLAGRVAILDHGSIKACGTPSQLTKSVTGKRKYALKLRKPHDRAIELLHRFATSSRPTADKTLQHTSFLIETADSMDISSIIQDLVLAGAQVVECTPVRHSLADVVNSLTNGST